MIQQLFKKKKFFKKNKNNNNKNKFKKNYQKKGKNIKNYDDYILYLKKKTPKITNYLHTNRKLKQGIFLKKPNFNDIIYPFSLNLKLINEYLKKK